MRKKLLVGSLVGVAGIAVAVVTVGLIGLLGSNGLLTPETLPNEGTLLMPLTEKTADATNSLPPQHPVEAPAEIDVAKMAEELGVNSARITKALTGVTPFEDKEMWFFVQLQSAETWSQVMNLYLRGNPPTEQLRKQALGKLLALSQAKHEISLVMRLAQTDRDADMEDKAIRALAEKFYKKK